MPKHQLIQPLSFGDRVYAPQAQFLMRKQGNYLYLRFEGRALEERLALEDFVEGVHYETTKETMVPVQPDPMSFIPPIAEDKALAKQVLDYVESIEVTATQGIKVGPNLIDTGHVSTTMGLAWFVLDRDLLTRGCFTSSVSTAIPGQPLEVCLYSPEDMEEGLLPLPLGTVYVQKIQIRPKPKKRKAPASPD